MGAVAKGTHQREVARQDAEDSMRAPPNVDRHCSSCQSNHPLKVVPLILPLQRVVVSTAAMPPAMAAQIPAALMVLGGGQILQRRLRHSAFFAADGSVRTQRASAAATRWPSCCRPDTPTAQSSSAAAAIAAQRGGTHGWKSSAASTATSCWGHSSLGLSASEGQRGATGGSLKCLSSCGCVTTEVSMLLRSRHLVLEQRGLAVAGRSLPTQRGNSAPLGVKWQDCMRRMIVRAWRSFSVHFCWTSSR